jgi:folate-dependent phosphoribosylglycinamide formyltransferase PurN
MKAACLIFILRCCRNSPVWRRTAKRWRQAIRCTVHFVTAQLDHGPIVAQAEVAVLPTDTEESLMQRVLVQEHLIYPQAVRWFIEGKLSIDSGQVRIAN